MSIKEIKVSSDLISSIENNSLMSWSEKLSALLKEADISGFSLGIIKTGLETEDIAKESFMVLKEHLLGKTIDVTEEVLKGNY